MINHTQLLTGLQQSDWPGAFTIMKVYHRAYTASSDHCGICVTPLITGEKFFAVQFLVKVKDPVTGSFNWEYVAFCCDNQDACGYRAAIKA